MTLEEKVNFLQNSYLSRGIDEAMIRQIAEVSHEKALAKGEHFSMKGDTGDSMFGVISGAMRIYIVSASGKEFTAATMHQNEFNGELPLLDGLPRIGNVVAETNSKLLVIPRQRFLDILNNNPAFMQHIILVLCSRLRMVAEITEDSLMLSMEARLAKILLKTGKEIGQEIKGKAGQEIKISQQELSLMVSVRRETVNICLQDWKQQGWIDLKRNFIIILDPEALEYLIEEN